MVCASQVPPKISASLSSQGEAQQPTEKRGDDEDDAVIFIMGVGKGCFCWIALYLKSQVAMVVVAEVVKRTFCVFCKHWRQLSSLRIGRRGSYSKCGRNYGKEEARVDPELGNYADFIHSSSSSQPTQ